MPEGAIWLELYVDNLYLSTDNSSAKKFTLQYKYTIIVNYLHYKKIKW